MIFIASATEADNVIMVAGPQMVSAFLQTVMITFCGFSIYLHLHNKIVHQMKQWRRWFVSFVYFHFCCNRTNSKGLCSMVDGALDLQTGLHG